MHRECNYIYYKHKIAFTNTVHKIRERGRQNHRRYMLNLNRIIYTSWGSLEIYKIEAFLKGLVN